MARPTSARELDRIPSVRASIRLLLRFNAPRLLAAQLVIALALRAALGPLTLVDGIILASIAVWWPFQEWLFHRYLLHCRPLTVFGRRLEAPGAPEHRAHHRRPWELVTILLPVRALFALIPLNLLLWWAITPDPARMVTGVAGITAVALWYEWLHFIVHLPYRPRTAWLARVTRNHRLHHFKNERHWYAFTLPSIDTMFGTNPDPKAVETSPTVRTLGVSESPAQGSSVG